MRFSEAVLGLLCCHNVVALTTPVSHWLIDVIVELSQSWTRGSQVDRRFRRRSVNSCIIMELLCTIFYLSVN